MMARFAEMNSIMWSREEFEWAEMWKVYPYMKGGIVAEGVTACLGREITTRNNHEMLSKDTSDAKDIYSRILIHSTFTGQLTLKRAFVTPL